MSAAILLTATMAGTLGVCAVAQPLTPPIVFACAASVLSMTGAGLGFLLGCLQLAIGRYSSRARGVIWPSVGLASGVAVALSLDAFRKVGGPHSATAVLTILVSLGGGTAAGALLLALQPSPTNPNALRKAPRGVRWTLIVALAVCGIALTTLEATMDILLAYPSARRAMTGLAWLCGASAALALLRVRAWTARTGILGWIGTMAILGAASVRLAAANDSELELLASADQSEHAIGLIRWATDWDRDGSSGFLGGGDCKPLDGAVHPRATEIPGNGVDDNCRYGDARPRVPAGPDQPVTRAVIAPPVDVVLITIDSLRADRTTPYGHHRDTTPNLARFARDALRFENAYSSGSWTCIAVPTMLAGTYARRLRWLQFGLNDAGDIFHPVDGRLPSGHTATVISSLPSQDAWSLQRSLQQRGIRTLAVLNRRVPQLLALRSGFDIFELSADAFDSSVTSLAQQRLASLGTDEAFFLWIHYFNPHEPQDTHDVKQFGDSIEAKYDHEVLATDVEVGKVLEAIEQRGRPTAVFVTSDHGEVFSDTWQFHGTDLNEETIRVPLLARIPGLRARTVTTPVSLVDLAPTILSLTGTDAPEGLDGTDLRHVDGDRAVITDLWRLDLDGKLYFDQVAVTNTRFRLTYDRLRNATTLSRVRDTRTPPMRLDRSRTPPILESTLGAYLESQSGGPISL